MQLSKREFSKLSNKDQALLMKNRVNVAKNNKSVQKRKKVGGFRPPQRSNLLSGEATGVASAYSKGVKGSKPKITRSMERGLESIRVTHREFIGNVTGTTAFAVANQIPLNPGLNTSFPWLSNVANNYEQYRVNKMRFEYLTRTGTNVPGSVLLAPDYDVLDAAPLSEAVMSNYEDIAEDAPWKDNCCVLRPAAMHAIGPKKFVRSGPVAASDQKTYDVGNFFLATVDGTAVSWGKLWVEYDISFFVPQLNPSGPPIFLGGIVFGGGTLNAANPLGSAPAQDPQAAGFSTSTASALTFTQTGSILVSYNVTGTGVTGATITPSAGAALIGSSVIFNAAATSGTVSSTFTVVPGSILTFGATATTVTSSNVTLGAGPTGSFA